MKAAKLEDYKVVYFATHALVAGGIDNLSEPALAFSVPATASELDDGLLTASEVSQLKLNADWVILSACNTATGSKPGAEALSGLTQAFFYAGAKALLVSHWAVDDEATASLMADMFSQLSRNKKLSRAVALQRSMLNYIDQAGESEKAYPTFWAPFFIVGLPN